MQKLALEAAFMLTSRTVLSALAPRAALFALLLVPAAASAQDLAGTYSLSGRYSNRRLTAVSLTITPGAGGALEVSRTARFTSRTYRNVPPFTWTASEVSQHGRLLQVTYTLDRAGASVGLAANLDPDALDRDAAVATVREGNTLRAVYSLAADGQTLNEVVVNATRRGTEAWYYWISTSGQRTGNPPGFVDGFAHIQDPSLYYEFGVSPSSLRKLTDDELIAGLRANPLDAELGRVSLVRTLIWSNVLAYRLDSNGHISPGQGDWRLGQITVDGDPYDVVHWKDVDDSSFTAYFRNGRLWSLYYEN